MKLLVCGHSVSANRQVRFFRYMDSLGHEVKLAVPNWKGNRIKDLQGVVDEFDPDVILVEDEKDGVAVQVTQVRHRGKIILFSWENLRHQQRLPSSVLKKYDLVVAGCPGAMEVLKARGLDNIHPHIIPQVGIDFELFRMEGGEREYDTVTCSGFTVNKGVHLISKAVKELGLNHLWLGWKRPFDIPPSNDFPDYGTYPGYMEYSTIPEWLSRAKVHVLASIDTPMWSEQFSPHANVEALACGLRVVTSDAGDIPYFLDGCPGVEIVPVGDVPGLKSAITNQLKDWEPNIKGREWCEKRYSIESVARKWLEAFSQA